MGIFDDIIKRASTEEAKAALKADPEVRKALEEIEQERLNLERVVDQWETYMYGPIGDDGVRRGGIWDAQAKNFVPVIEAQKKLEAAQERIKTLEEAIAEGSDMDFDQILKNLREKGFVTKDEVPTRNDLNGMAAAFEYLYSKTADLPTKYFSEFGKPMNFAEFMDYMRKNNLVANPDLAYDNYVASQREAKKQEEMKRKEEEYQKAIEAAKKEAYERAKQEASMSSQNLPVEITPAAYSPYVLESLKKATVTETGSIQPPPGSRVGDGVRAAIAAKMLREGKLAENAQAS